MDYSLLLAVGRILRLYPEANLVDALSFGQIESKKWLIRELKNHTNNLGTVYLCCGWYAILAAMLYNEGFDILNVYSIDIDPECVPIAKTFNLDNKETFKTCVNDIYDMNYKSHVLLTQNKDDDGELTNVVIPARNADTVINTSCEHLTHIDRWYNRIPDGVTVVVQSNDYFENKQHTNCVDDLEEFKRQIPLSELYYAGEMEFDYYTRFMLIGKK